MSSDDHHRHGPETELRSFGRRRGRKLTERQARLLRDLLPAVCIPLADPAPADIPGTLFGSNKKELWLEIGFGGGEHLVAQASRNPQAGFIGCEPFEDGVVKVLTAIDEQGLRNIRVHADDARTVLRWLPPASLDRVFILFPDPWPKVRHRKRRLVSAAMLALVAGAMKPGAELRIATDIGDYARTMLMAVRDCPALRWIAEAPSDWRIRPEDWPPTRYEQKAVREGRKCIFFRFRRAAR